MSQLRAGIIRYAKLRPGRSSARCDTCRHGLCDQVNPRQAGEAARKHTRDTGHPTAVRHIQAVSYRLEQT